MPEYLHPGVYVEETDAHPQPIEGVSTTTFGPFSSRPLRRPLFFAGRLLGAGDLQAEQDYHREKLRRHALALHGVGIVRGLEVRLDDDECAPSARVQIGPGIAVDAQGELIELPVWVARALPPVAVAPLVVTLRHWERPCDPTPGLDGSTVHASVEEACVVGIGAGVPPHALVLAVLHGRDGRWRIAMGRSSHG